MNIDGIWYAPRNDGCGLFVHSSKGKTGIGYYGHSLDGHNLHLTGAAEDITHIPLIITTGNGVPTTSVKRESDGFASLMPNADGTLSVKLTLDQSKLSRLDFSPPPQPGTYRDYYIECERLL